MRVVTESIEINKPRFPHADVAQRFGFTKHTDISLSLGPVGVIRLPGGFCAETRSTVSAVFSASFDCGVVRSLTVPTN